MTTWMLYGGPRHQESGDGPVPEGYEFVSTGRELSPVYGLRPRGFDEIYRWHEDVAYIRDGREILRKFNDGELAVAAEYADAANAVAGIGMEALQVGIGFIADQPTSDDAQRARALVDTYRQHGTV